MPQLAEDKFIESYKRLNTAQKEAVDTIEGPVMVVAGPGTGKTQILTLRIANILRQTDTPANGILALTFTEAGQKAMRARLRSFVGSRADEVGIFTYHGFASSVIADYPEHFLHLARARQLSDVEAETLLREILREKRFAKLRPLGDPEFYVGKIIRAISECRKEAWTPEFVRDYAGREIERVKNDPDSVSSRGATKGKLKAEAEKQIERAERTLVFAQVYERYEERKREERRYDFDDLIFELISALEEDELLLRLIQERYLYILVDEHQDTNNSQNLLIRKIADFFDDPNLFVVGDEKQAIYRFQGASVQNFLEFQSTWPSMKVISLVNNYRSHQSILDASFRMIENNYGADEHKHLRVRLEAAGEETPEPVEVVLAGNNVAVEKYLAEEIRKVTEGEPTRTVAVIVRTNREAERALEVLASAGIRAASERGADIFSHPIGVLFFKLLEFLADESKVESLAYTLSGGLWGLRLAQSAPLIKRLRSGDLGDLENELPELARLKHLIAKTGTIEFLILAAEVSGLTKLVASEPLATEVWRSIVVMAEDLARTKRLEDPRLLVQELLDYRQMAESRSIKISAGVSDAKVLVMTAHSSKGLEFDYVFLPYATEESWMPRGRGQNFVLPLSKDEGDEVRDARRLFYVALTRARKHVSIIVGLSSAPDRPLSPLRFIGELDEERMSRVEIPEMQSTEPFPLAIAPEEKDKIESVEYAKHRLLEGGLSVTALNHFAECPSKFFYKSILKLPEPPSAPSEKGNAMHEALAAVWISQDKSRESIASTISHSVENYFKHSLLPFYERELVAEELQAAAPKVAEALFEHFQSGQAAAEKWEETNFVGKFGEEELNLRLHGKLDAIVEATDKILVFDYKTRDALSQNAIKGETKSSDGGYFRQLIFYKLLLSGNYRYAGKPIEPALVFVKPDAKGRCPIVSVPIENSDLERVRKEIQSLIDCVWSGRIMTETCDDPKCEYCRLKRLR